MAQRSQPVAPIEEAVYVQDLTTVFQITKCVFDWRFPAYSVGRWEIGLPVFEVLQGCMCVWFLGEEPGTIEPGNIALFGLVILLQIKWKNFKNFLRLVLSVLVVVSFLYVGFS